MGCQKHQIALVLIHHLILGSEVGWCLLGCDLLVDGYSVKWSGALSLE